MRGLLVTLCLVGCQGATVDAPAADAAVEDGTVEDGAFDTTASDTAPRDGSSETTAGDGATACPGWFCARFDGVAQPETEWTRKIVGGTGFLAFDEAMPASSPRSVRIGFAKDLSVASDAQLEKRIVVTPTVMRLELQVRLETVPTDRVPFLKIGRGGSMGAQLVWDGGSPVLEVLGFAGGEASAALSTPIRPGLWHQVAVEVSFAKTATGFVRAYVDGVFAAELKDIATTDRPDGETIIVLGPHVSGSLNPFTMWADDVVLRAP